VDIPLKNSTKKFSPMNTEWLKLLLSRPELNKMGHGQCGSDLNIGLGWLYYAQVRILRPRHIVCIGSWRGFVPLVLGKGLVDNAQNGRVTFIDPSMVDDFWSEPEKVRAWFASFGLNNIDHHRCTTQEFLKTDSYEKLDRVGILFVDGFHSAEQAKFDHEAFMPLLEPESCVFFHDAVRKKMSGIYGPGKAYEHTVCDYIEELRTRTDLQVFDHSLADGVAIVSQRFK
jgi:predicted O-methyltransferase YrrM